MSLHATPRDDRDIDWDLLMLLARTEAAMRWPDAATDPGDGSDRSLPEGLDLRHSWDLDWVSRVAADYAPPPLASLRLP